MVASKRSGGTRKPLLNAPKRGPHIRFMEEIASFTSSDRKSPIHKLFRGEVPKTEELINIIFLSPSFDEYFLRLLMTYPQTNGKAQAETVWDIGYAAEKVSHLTSYSFWSNSLYLKRFNFRT